MRILITADLHLTDNPIEQYRWDVFRHLCNYQDETEANRIYILGDITDRKDRHSSFLVNRLVKELDNLTRFAPIDITMGNHDMPLQGPPFWDFLNEHSLIRYITKPVWDIDDCLLLPFSINPREDWKDTGYQKATALFLHQTVEGACVDGNRKIPKDVNPMPNLDYPFTCIISGDVHKPQELEKITYVGAPHPVRFSETWTNRFLLLDTKLETLMEIPIPSIKRRILDISDSKEVPTDLRSGDQVRIRYKLNQDKLPQWPDEQEKIKQWGIDKNILIVSIEALFEDQGGLSDHQTPALTPTQIYNDFCEAEKVSDQLKNFGKSILDSCSH